ncbi:hypothetical protein DB41_II00060 [Neochlamydia sp. TUME1]|nr:hypothetical protein DB41_II00060 [Neochlamydia sp. TUME1]
MQLYNQSVGLFTDLYQLSMSYGYWKAGLEYKEAVFQLFFAVLLFRGDLLLQQGLKPPLIL